MRRLLTSLAIGSLVLGVPAVAWGQTQPRVERITFAKGASGAVRSGAIKGYQTVDYKLNVRAGQALNIGLETRHGATYFNLIEPGQTSVAVHVGSINGNQFQGVAAKNGDYTIRVYMMRSAARRNEAANYRLETRVGFGQAAQLPGRPSYDALVPGTSFNATGSISCSFARMAPQMCDMGVERQGGGTASVHVTGPRGVKRVIFFDKGQATGYDASQADAQRFSALRRGDETVVTIGMETYVIPDAVPFGG